MTSVLDVEGDWLLPAGTQVGSLPSAVHLVQANARKFGLSVIALCGRPCSETAAGITDANPRCFTCEKLAHYRTITGPLPL
jgi:hypothetical protein